MLPKLRLAQKRVSSRSQAGILERQPSEESGLRCCVVSVKRRLLKFFKCRQFTAWSTWVRLGSSMLKSCSARLRCIEGLLVSADRCTWWHVWRDKMIQLTQLLGSKIDMSWWLQLWTSGDQALWRGIHRHQGLRRHVMRQILKSENCRVLHAAVLLLMCRSLLIATRGWATWRQMKLCCKAKADCLLSTWPGSERVSYS